MADVTTSFAAKDAGFTATMNRLQSRLSAFTKRMAGVQAASVKMSSSFASLGRSVIGLTAAYVGASAAISGFTKAMSFGGQMSDFASITGESAGNLAVLERAFDNTGVGGEKMIPMIAKMTDFIDRLGKGNKEAEATANILGVTFQDLEKKTPVERLKLLTQAMAGVKNENDQINSSMDVFGAKVGPKLITFANSFDESMGQARKQLGSVVDILDRSADRLDNLGDILENSLGNKLRDFAIGFLDGAQGADELATKLSEIDTAAAGIDVGKIFSGIVEEPMQGFLAMGEILLLGVTKAGNALINATLHAAKVYADALTKMELWSAVASMIVTSLAQVANFLTRAFLSAIKKGVLEPLSNLPSWLGGDIYKGLLNQFEKVQGFFDEEAASNAKMFADDASKIGTALMDSMRNVPMEKSKDFLGAENQGREVEAILSKLKDLGSTGGQVAEQTKQTQAAATESTKNATQAQNENTQTVKRTRDELNRIYNEQSQRIRDANLSTKDFGIQLRALNNWMNSEMAQLTQPVAQVGAASLSPQQRNEAIQSASAKTQEAQKEPSATESTLQKVVMIIEDLALKLPAPVLV